MTPISAVPAEAPRAGPALMKAALTSPALGWAALGLAALAAMGVAAPASAQHATLELTHGKVFTDAAGAYVGVSVKNTGASTVAEVFVSCEFFRGRASLGKSSTTVFSIVSGLTGSDQVRLLGGSRAERAECAITGSK